MQDRHCRVCSGSGYTYVNTITPNNPVNFVFFVVEALLPWGGRRVKCHRCRGRGYFQAIKTNYRR